MQGEVPSDQYWGKLRKDEAGRVLAWHPLEDHCADVAACARALLELPLWNRRLARLGDCELLDSKQVERLAVIAAFHDLGKFNLGFQRKALPLDMKAQVAGHVDELVQLFNDESPEPILAEALRADRFADWCKNGPESFFQLLFAAASHHGAPVQPKSTGTIPAVWKPAGARNPFSAIAGFAQRVEGWLPGAFTPGRPLPNDPKFQHAFAGLVMLADWIASGFPYSEEGATERFPFALDRARALLEAMKVDCCSARSHLEDGLPEFGPLFNLATGASARPAQQALISAPVSREASIEVLEAETGSGKTEAAIYRYLQHFAAGEVDGLYFALPTRTAALQLYNRVCAAIGSAFPEPCRPAVTLAVPGYLRVDGVDGQRLPDFQTLWPDADRFRYRAWAAEQSKRFLVGPVVVGTIDQVLLSALAVKHSQLRATPLLRHYLVIDEVHASDGYMTRILREVLRHHLAAGGHALLMSATLGAEARTELLSPQRRGTGPVPPLEEALRTPYPLVSRSVAPTFVPVAEAGLPKSVEVSVSRSADESDRIAAMALDAASEGGRVAILRNTVRDAVRTQEALERVARDRGHEALLFRVERVATLHHSRFSKPDRERLDEAVERGFGRGSPSGGRVIVATQTIQQSLDLDLDWLLTDLCPMDVLLQRVGRLHRHPDRGPSRPTRFREAKLEVLVPSERDLARYIRGSGLASGPHGFGTVYRDLRVLEATWQLLEERMQWEIPRDNRLLVERSTHPDALASAIGRYPEEKRWKAHQTKMIGVGTGERAVAATSCLDWSKPFGSGELPLNAAREISTRLGEHDRAVEFTSPLPVGPFGKPVPRLTVPAFLAKEETSPGEPIPWHQRAPGALEFRLGKEAFLYDRLGLRGAAGADPKETSSEYE